MTGTTLTVSDRPRRGTLLACGLAALGLLAACDEQGNFNFGSSPEATEGTQVVRSTQLVERDVEAPDVFQVTEEGLWDGRPSLGGVWVAHPTVQEPERVIIRNRENGKFVIGALFRRERDLPGPLLQVSSDAAAALGILPGAPTELNVTALRREEVAENAPTEIDTAETDPLEAPGEISATALDPVTAAPAAAAPVVAAAADAVTPEVRPESRPQLSTAALENAIAAAEAQASPVAEAPVPSPAPATAPGTPTAKLDKPFIQIGIFSVETNATRTADRLRGVGIVPTVLKQESQGRVFWRVVVGPATNRAERATLLEKVKGMGFGDAYAVTN